MYFYMKNPRQMDMFKLVDVSVCASITGLLLTGYEDCKRKTKIIEAIDGLYTG